jgi:hypothetical protein
MAAIHYKQCNVKKSLELLVKAEKMCREIEYKEGLAISLMGQAVIAAFKEKRQAHAMEIARDAFNIVDSCGMRVLANRMQNIQSSIEKSVHCNIVNGVHEEGPGLVMWVVKKQKLDKNS